MPEEEEFPDDWLCLGAASDSEAEAEAPVDPAVELVKEIADLPCFICGKYGHQARACPEKEAAVEPEHAAEDEAVAEPEDVAEEVAARTTKELGDIVVGLHAQGVKLDAGALGALRLADKKDALAVLRSLRSRVGEVKAGKLKASEYVRLGLAEEGVQVGGEEAADEDFPDEWAEEAAEAEEEAEEEEASRSEEEDVEVEEEVAPPKRLTFKGKGGKGLSISFRTNPEQGPDRGKGKGKQEPVTVKGIKRKHQPGFDLDDSEGGPKAPSGKVIRAPMGKILRLGPEDVVDADHPSNAPSSRARNWDKMVCKDGDDLADLVQNLKARDVNLNEEALEALRNIRVEAAVAVLDELSDRAALIENHSDHVIKYCGYSEKVTGTGAEYSEVAPELMGTRALMNPNIFKLRLGALFKAEDDKKGKGKGKKKGPGEKPPGCTTLVVRQLSYEATEGDILAFFEKVGPVRDCRLLRDRETGESRGIAFVTYGQERLVDIAVKLKGEIAGRQFSLAYAEGKGKGKGKKKGKGKEPNPKPENCTQVMVRCLSPEVTEEHLLELFESVGPIKECRLLKDRETGDSRCLAFVDYDDEDLVDEAVKLSGTELKGQEIIVDYAAGKGKGKDKGKGKGDKKGKEVDQRIRF